MWWGSEPSAGRRCLMKVTRPGTEISHLIRVEHEIPLISLG